MFSVGRTGALQIMSSNMNFRKLNFPNMMADRGFPKDESDGVKDFFYRTDGYKLWYIINQYVAKAVHKVYPSDFAVIQDVNLQAFAVSLSDPLRGNILGWPSTIARRSSLIEVLSTVVFTASVQHQVINKSRK